MSSNNHQFQLASSIKNLNLLEQELEHYFIVHKVPDDMQLNIVVAATEAVLNAIVHGNGNDEKKMVSVELGFDGKELIISIADQGSGFDANQLPDPTGSDLIDQENGRGILIMKNLADNLEYQLGGREVRLHFNA